MSIDPVKRERARDDLEEIVRGELMFDELNRAFYSTDASLFEIEPIGAVAPLDDADLQAVVRYCFENKIPLIPRGAGTGLAGESLGDGVILDLSRHFRGIRDIAADTVRVQPGVVLQHLNAELAKVGRRFAPDSASGASCTLGGMLATNASGSRCIKYGYTRDHVLGCQVVLDNGDLVEAAHELIGLPVEYPPRLGEIVLGVTNLLRNHADLIRESQPATPFNRCGYLLADVLKDDVLSLPRLLVGSEGTLAIFTEATLKTIPLAGGRSVVLLGFASLEKSLRAVRLAVATGPSACELLDRRLISLARNAVGESSRLLPGAIEAALLIEYEADHPIEAQAAAEALIRTVHEKQRLSLLADFATSPREMEQIWRLRDSALPNLYGMGHGPRPVAIIEDIGVPPEALGEFLIRVQDVLQQNDMTASFLTHAATGQVHMRPFLNVDRPGDAGKLWALADAVYTLVLGLGGTISAQHGTGLSRTPWLPRQYGRLYPVFGELKSIFDPNRILNPGKIVGVAVDRPAWPMRTVPRPPAAEAPPRAPLSLIWQADEVKREVLACNGCGHCRVQSSSERMCPVFHVNHSEAATPRAKANLLRKILDDPDPKRVSADDVRAVADLCVNCKMCAGECPARVNIPKLMLEAKAAHHAEHGLERSDWFLSRIELFAALGSRLSVVANPLLESRTSRWLLERLFGISRHRRLPAFAPGSYLSEASRRGFTRLPKPNPNAVDRVVYFVDVFANYNDPLVAEAAVAVLRHNQVQVYVPPGQWSSGMALFALGDVETARELAERNLRVLAPLARDGWRIVCSEPSAALMLSHDYQDLIASPEVKVVAQQTVELMAFLRELSDRGLLRTDFQPVNLAIGQHVPCHIKALGREPASAQLLGLIPELRLHTIDVSCSGMAGTYGLKRRNYWASLEAGRPMLEEIRKPRVLFGAAECSACRLQMEDGSGKRAMHPVQYLALAYGLVPEIADRLHTPLQDRFIP